MSQHTEQRKIYLDQNILDLLVKEPEGGKIKGVIQRSGEVFYSDQNLEEIYHAEIRSQSSGKGTVAPRFLNVLDSLNARYIEPSYDKKGLLKSPVQATLHGKSVADVFRNFENRKQQSNGQENAILDMLFKFFGGLPEKTMAEINQRGFEGVEETIDEILADPATPDELFQLGELAKSAVTASTDELRKVIEENQDQMQLAVVRDSTEGANPKHLNHISGPGVIEKIFKSLGGSGDLTLDSAMAIAKDPNNEGRILTVPEKVRGIYMFLNIIGFNPDSKMHQERGFRRALGDTEHAYYASFSELLISGDYSFVRKSAAAFEYLSLNTLILHLGINTKEGTITPVFYGPPDYTPINHSELLNKS